VILVAENVADTRDRSPRDMRFAFFQLLGKTAAGFGEDLEVAFNELSCTPVHAKLTEIVTRRVRLDVCDGLEDVTNVDFSIRRLFPLREPPDPGLRDRVPAL
jgi:hypothetical protein